MLLTCRWAKLPQGAVKRERDYHSWAEYAPHRHKDTDNGIDTDNDKDTDNGIDIDNDKDTDKYNIKDKHDERIGSEGAPGDRKRQTDTKSQVQKNRTKKEEQRKKGKEEEKIFF